MQKLVLAVGVFIVGTAVAVAQQMSGLTNVDDIKWGPAPPNVPAGAQLATLSGDPSKDEPFVIRLKLPANYRVPAHNHPTTEFVTVISGEFYVGMGDKLEEQKSRPLRPGGYVAMAAKMNHYGWTKGDTIIQIQAQGPFAITYVDPADDPSRK
jgi:quercetin dioxygenase-like cupin family protein